MSDVSVNTPTNVAGLEGSPVPYALSVMRLADLASLQNGRASATIFALSSADKLHESPRLSVWVEGLTSVEAAWILTGRVRERRAVLTLPVAAIRALVPTPPEPIHPGLEVEWERATILDALGNRVVDFRPGAEGHAGIARLDDRFGTKTQRKSLRVRLADLATVRILNEVELDRIAAAT